MEGLFKQESYFEFMPLRQSSTIGDETLPMNGTEVYANISTVWHEGFLVREQAKEKTLDAMNALNEGMRDATLNTTLSNSFNITQQNSFMDNPAESFGMKALNFSPPKNDASLNVREESAYESFYTALDFTLPQDNEDMTSNDLDRENLDDTLLLTDDEMSS